MVLNLLDEVFACFVAVSGSEYDCCFDHLAADFVGNAGDGTFDDGGVCHQSAFDFEWADAIARRLDDVVFTTDEPEVSVFVAPSNVAGMVDVVVVCLVGELRVAVVFFEQAERAMSFVCANHYFALFAVFSPAAVGGEQVDVVFRTFFAHRAGFGLEPRVGRYGECCFGLSEAFHKFYSGKAFPLFVDARVEGFAGDSAIFQAGDVEFRQVFAN